MFPFDCYIAEVIQKMKVALVTGSNSGLGFEAARQLGKSGEYKAVYLGCRTQEKCDVAAAKLSELCNKPESFFPALVLDVSRQKTVFTAVDKLDLGGGQFSSIILNAGGVSKKKVVKTEDGFEMTVAASLLGHHTLFFKLLEQGLLAADAHVVLASSEASRGDVAAFKGMQPANFRKMATSINGNTDAALSKAVQSAILVEKPYKYDFQVAYATAKALLNFWVAGVADKVKAEYPNMVIVAVSPGSVVDTAALSKMPQPYKTMMKLFGKRLFKLVGASMPIDVGAKRYIDALSFGTDDSGDFYASKPTKITGRLVKQNHELYIKENNKDLQEATYAAVVELVKVGM